MTLQNFGKSCFVNGECLKVMADIPDGYFDMILCDLPYGTTQNKWDSVIDLKKLWKQYKRICKGAVVLTAQTPFDKVLGASNIESLRYEWLWVKTKATGHLNANRQPLKNHENILVFGFSSFPYYPQGLVRKEKPTVRKGRCGNGSNYGKSDKDALQEFENYPRSVIEFSSEGKNFHPTQKPVDLFEYLIRTYTNEGQRVLDNTAGSGTTAIAAINSNREWVCIEQSEEYFNKAIERVKAHLALR